MNESNCRAWACELVECARAWVAPRSELRQHLRECPECAARWASERNLTTHFQALKEAAAVGQPAQAQRERIMRQFALQRRRTVQSVLRWALAAAAALVLTVGVGSSGVEAGWARFNFPPRGRFNGNRRVGRCGGGRGAGSQRRLYGRALRAASGARASL